MISRLSKINDILASEFLSNSSNFEEPSIGMNVQVKRNKCNSIMYQFDKQLSKTSYKGGLFPFFAKNKGVCKICDYMIFAEKNSKIWVLVIELKKGKQNTKPQLNAAECLAKYINLTYNRMYKTNEEFLIRKISIHEYKRRKKRTKNSEVNYDHDNHTIFDSMNFYTVAHLV